MDRCTNVARVICTSLKLGAFAFLMSAGVSWAVPFTWTGLAGDNLWSNINNWSPVGLPGAGDSVTIPAGATAVTISAANVTVQSLDLQRALSLAANRTLTVATAAITGPISLNGGSTLSGTYTIGAGGNITFPARCGFGRLDNATINGSITGFTGGMRWNNVTLNGTIAASGASTSEIVFEGSQTVTGTLLSAVSGASSLMLSSNANGTLTIAPGAKIQGGNIEFSRSSPCLGGGGTYNVVNNGMIIADVGGRSIDFNGGSAVGLTNNGTIDIAGGTFSLSTFNGAAGTMNLSSGTLNTGGANPSQLGTFNRTGGSAVINGVADLAGGTWSPSGAWSFTSGGTVQNGTINLASGSLAFPARCSFGRLSNITLNGNLSNFTGGMRWNAVTLNGTLTASGSSTAEIVFEGSQTLTGTLISNVSGSSSLLLSTNANGTLTIAPSAKIQGGNIEFARSSACLGGGGTYNVVNNGTIDANVAGRAIDFNGSSPVGLTNNGTINISGGTFSLSTFSGAAGTINLSSGTLNTGAANPSQLGTFNRTGGTATINGVADLGGGTWTPTGTWTFLSGGGVQNGTINLASGGFAFPARCAFGRLSNVVLNGNLPSFSGGLRWNNVTLNGTLTAIGASSSEIVFEGSQTLTGTFVSNVSGSGSLIFSTNASGTLTIAPSAKIQGGNIDFYVSSPCIGGGGTYNVVNNGTIDANVAGRAIDFGPSTAVPLTNNGTINITTGTLSVRGFTGTAGTINFSGGVLNFGGTLTQLGTFNRSGGTANIVGTAELANLTWSPIGTWTFASAATVQNGAINLSSGSIAFPARCAFGRLNNVTLNGNLPSFSGGLRWNNVTLNGTLTSSGTVTSEIVFEGSQTLTGTIVSNVSSGSLILSTNTNGTLTIAPSAKIQGGNIDFYSSSPCLGGGGTYDVINNGTIDANVAGRTIDFTLGASVPLTNNGTINIPTGSLTVRSFTGAAGTMNLTGGVLNYGGTLSQLGTFTRSGGTANIIGTVEVGGVAWSPVGVWNLIASSTVQNGTINLSSGNLAFPPRCSFGRLSNITLNGNIPGFTGGLRWNNVTLNGTLTATGAATSEIVFEGSQTVTGTLVSSVTNTASLILSTNANGTLTVAPSARIQGANVEFYRSSPCVGGGGTYAVVNNGTIDASVAGRTIEFNLSSPTPITNNGSLIASAGNISLSSATNNGLMKAGPGTTISVSGGTLSLSPTSTLEIELKGPPPSVSNFGRVTLSNNAASTLALGGTLKVRNVAAYTPTCGLEWNIIASSLAAAGTPITGTFSALDFPFPGEGNLQRLVYAPKSVSFFIATQADFNEDGFITFEDFDEFVSAFEAGEGRSDFNADGFLTFEDFDAFVSKFEGGC